MRVAALCHVLSKKKTRRRATCELCQNASALLNIALRSLRICSVCLPVADNVHNSRAQCSEVVSYTNCSLHTADSPAPRILLVQNCSRPRPRLELLVLHSELVVFDFL